MSVLSTAVPDHMVRLAIGYPIDGLRLTLIVAALWLSACENAAVVKPTLVLRPGRAVVEGAVESMVLPSAQGTVRRAVMWTSSDAAVAAIDSEGTLTAMSLGVTRIRAVYRDTTWEFRVTVVPNYFLGSGDIATCVGQGDERTSDMILALPGTVFTTGDNVYDSGTAAEFAACFEPSWGRLRGRLRPSPGNHDYLTLGASAYFAYFGSSAGAPGRGFYSYRLGAWHIVSLNSEVPTGAGSEQYNWLVADLAQNARWCVLAYWHRPLFSSGAHGNQVIAAPFWALLDEHHAEVVLNGHDHVYERFEPQTPLGVADIAHGIRQFTVGTGGNGLRTFGTPKPNSAVRLNTGYGILQLRLAPGSYQWWFRRVTGVVADSGSGSCH